MAPCYLSLNDHHIYPFLAIGIGPLGRFNSFHGLNRERQSSISEIENMRACKCRMKAVNMPVKCHFLPKFYKAHNIEDSFLVR